jgi:hypothetical protein
MADDRLSAGIVISLAVAMMGLGVGAQLLRRWGKNRRRGVYDRLAAELGFSANPPVADPVVPELAAATLHLSGECDGFLVRIVENASDYIEEGQPLEAQTSLVLSRADWRLPLFKVEPRSFATGLRQKVDGNKGMFFPKDEHFTLTCFVDGPDQNAIRACLVPAATAMMRDNKRLYVESRGSALLVYESEKQLSVKRTRELLGWALAFAQALVPID